MSYVIVRKPFNLRGLFPCLQNGLQCVQRERCGSHISAVEHLVFSRCLLISSPFEFGVEYRTWQTSPVSTREFYQPVTGSGESCVLTEFDKNNLSPVMVVAHSFNSSSTQEAEASGSL